jgi:long-chain acyl-CoA synthetase
MMSVCFAYYGSAIAFFRGDMLKLMEDIAIAKPTAFVGVPRVLNRLYDAITSKFALLP